LQTTGGGTFSSADRSGGSTRKPDADDEPAGMDDVNPRRSAAQLIAAVRWFALATLDEHGSPALSYVPFAAAGGAFAIVASRLAAHTANLLARRPATIILVDADARGDAYAQPRLSIQVSACPQPRGSAEADAIWSALVARHGATATILRTLPDFEAISLAPGTGRLVSGFASAHDLDASAIVDSLRTASLP
jgi:putative heme iron utilization protein